MKLLIVGCGSIGRRHALSAQKLHLTFALCDTNEQCLSEVALETGASASFTSLQQALKWQPQMAVIATPHTQHIPQALELLKNQVDVLIEKPVSNTLDQAYSLNNHLKSSSQKAFVVCNLRFHPAIKALKNNLTKLGKIHYARAHYGNFLPNMRPNADYRQLYCAQKKNGGGVILDAIHEIDYLMWMLGSVKKSHIIYDKISDLDIDVEDFANINLQHENACYSTITLDYLRPWKRRGCEIIGSKGTLIWESEGKQPEACHVRHYDIETKTWQTLYETDNLDNGQPFIDMLHAFINHKTNSKTPLQTALEASQRLTIALSSSNTPREAAA